MSPTEKERVYIYDSTLRDGAQTRGVDFNVIDKQDIALELDKFGIDYIEGGWPGANPTDDEFFEKAPKLKSSRLTSFGMTRKSGRSAKNDPTLAALLDTGTKAICIVGKSSAYQAKTALGVSQAENLKMISESIKYLVSKGREVLFDAEHFFDGYKSSSKDYTLKCAFTAYEAGARWVVLCDTNGGTLPHEIERIVKEVTKFIPGKNLGIHCHNDTENAVANSLAAVRAGVRQVQGTLNGLGERCGNANLVSIIPSLMLKMGFDTGIKDLKQLTHISRYLDEKLNRHPNIQAAYVGAAAFSHKGGLHVSAVAKNPDTYEHIKPEAVGNNRTILVSDQAGRSNFVDRLAALKIKYDEAQLKDFIREVKEMESSGYSFDGADASFELMARKRFGRVSEYFHLTNYRVITERRYNAKNELITTSEATVKLKVKGKAISTVGEGIGPINALDKALRVALAPAYTVLNDTKLVDYKVRIITPGLGTKAVTRVLIETEDQRGKRWSTIGVSENVIDASYNAIADSLFYALLKQ